MSESTEIKISLKGFSGRCWHYGHFIHDVIMPIIKYLNSQKKLLTKIHIINKQYESRFNLHKTSVGSFKPIAEKILGLEVNNIDASEYPEMPIVELKSCSVGPYTDDDCKYILPHVFRYINIEESKYDVLLIERGVKPLANNIIDTGANRRCLKGHNIIKEGLKNVFEDKFKNVILEDLSIDTQISLFYNAKIVIGQHGAGLCNIIFMSDKAQLVIELPPYPLDTFKEMCFTKKIPYIRCKPDEIYLYIDKTNGQIKTNIISETLPFVEVP